MRSTTFLHTILILFVVVSSLDRRPAAGVDFFVGFFSLGMHAASGVTIEDISSVGTREGDMGGGVCARVRKEESRFASTGVGALCETGLVTRRSRIAVDSWNKS